MFPNNDAGYRESKDIPTATSLLATNTLRKIAFWAILAGCSLDVLWVIWGSRYFVLQDLPDHIARASILKDYWLSPFIRHYFRLVHFPVPYLLPDIFNAGLLFIFNALIVLKIYETVSAFIMIAGVGYFIRRMTPTRMELALFPFAILFTDIFMKGNLNFIIGIGALFFLLGWWWDIRWKCTLRQEIFITLGGLLLYNIHLICLLALFLIAGISFIRHCFATKTVEYRKLWPALPSLAMTTAYSLWDGSGALTGAPGMGALKAPFVDIGDKYHSLLIFFNNFSFTDWYLFTPLIGLFLFWVIVAFRHSIRTEESIIFLALVGLFLLAPTEIKNVVARPDERILFIAFLWGLKVAKPPEKGEIYFRYAWVCIVLFVGLLQSVKTTQAFKEYGRESGPYYTLLELVPAHRLVCNLLYAERRVHTHFYKLLIPEKQDVVTGMFTNKQDCIRYRQPLPQPSPPPIVTDSLLRTYDYFIAHGMSDQIQRVVVDRKLTIIWCTDEIALLRSNMVSRDQ